MRALHQLRFVFADTAPTLRFVPGVTLGDIARLWSEMGEAAGREPLGVAVTFAGREAARGTAQTGTCPTALKPDAQNDRTEQ